MRYLSAMAYSFLALFICLAAPSGAFAWGEYGHMTVCDLAYRNLTDPSKEALIKLFHGKQGITVLSKNGVDTRHYTSFNVGCLEEDARPRRHPDDHFINVDRKTKNLTSEACPVAGTCIFVGIKRDLAILRDTSKSDEDRVAALMAVGHWIGDIHQPLHISFEDDTGGNDIKVKMKTTCGTSTYKPSYLHALWDNCLLEASIFEKVRKKDTYKPGWGYRTITYRAVDTLQANTTLTEEKSMVGTDPVLWADESFQITLQPNAQYCVQVGDSCQYTKDEPVLVKDGKQKKVEIAKAYLDEYGPIAEQRVRLAGFRLAHLINLALDPDYKEPVQNSTQLP
ncbi:S1/P1 nuclease [Rhizobium sp. BR 249]|uniref:S1/P1 nuclease n=1 Tax=Rhizobium sp. BR 249 TaxID=3040011 RepID=UPI0039BFC8AD